MATPSAGGSKGRDHLDVVLQPYSKSVAKELRRSRGEIACAECRRSV